jgi:hypothetical protein
VPGRIRRNGGSVPDVPTFEPAQGNCEAQRCANPAKYRAMWPYVSKLVCENHRRAVDGKSWPDVSRPVFGSKPTK